MLLLRHCTRQTHPGTRSARTPYYNRGFARCGTHLCAHNFPSSLVSFLYCAVYRKTTKCAVILDFITKFKISRKCVCANILDVLNVLNKKFRGIFLCFPIPFYANRKPTWRSKVRSFVYCLYYTQEKKRKNRRLQTFTNDTC